MSSSINENKNISILLGNPKRAIIKISIPMILANIVQTLYNIVDAVWVSGIGGNALASIGVFFPFNMAIVSLCIGMSTGVSTSIARFIGAGDFENANKSANQSLILTFFLSVSFMLLLSPTISIIFRKIGLKGIVYNYALLYAYPLIYGNIFLFLTNTIYGILRGSGNSRGTMVGIICGALINIILDPIFIYFFKLGVLGASIATIISQFISLVVVFRIMINKSNLLKIKFNYLNVIKEKFYYKNKKIIFDNYIIKDIIIVALPSALAQLSMSLAMFFINYFVLRVSDSTGLAIFTSSWRIILLAIVPLTGLAASSNVVIGANYGRKSFGGVKTSYFYSIFFGIVIELIIFILINIFSKEISYIFSLNKENIEFIPLISQSIRYLSIFIPFVSFGMNSSSFFQGIGNGRMALIITIIRTIILQIFFSFLFGVFFKLGIKGICIGISLANITGSFIGFSIGCNELKKMRLILSK
ncbi:MAG: MATE family efflux transporter [Spirochaetes bacterium]|nr:MATE family efflux transporter [Spirochaetota bacterium]